VRGYRRLMTESRYAFLRLLAPGWRWQVHNRAPAGLREIEQRVQLTPAEPNPSRPVLHFQGTLDRPPFAEITEVSPPLPTGAATCLRTDAGTLWIDAGDLPALAEVRAPGSSRSWELADDAARLVVDGADAGASDLEVLIVCSLREMPR
jgi:hypothetical protein